MYHLHNTLTEIGKLHPSNRTIKQLRWKIYYWVILGCFVFILCPPLLGFIISGHYLLGFLYLLFVVWIVYHARSKLKEKGL